MINEPKIKNKKEFSSLVGGLFIASTPLLGYALAFAYEAGFCRTFNIPISYIELSLTRIFAVAGTLIVIFSPFLLLMQGLSVIKVSRKNAIGRGFARLSYPGLVFLIYFYLFPLAWRQWIWLVGIFLFFVFLTLGLPLFTQPEKHTYKEKLEAEENEEIKANLFLHQVRKKLGSDMAMIVPVLLMTILASNLAGRAQAEKQREFLVINSKPELVVLRNYGNELICATFDRSKKVVFSNFHFLERKSINYTNGISLKLENVGPFKS